ncbi:MAG: hypothetical protein ACLP9L_14235, partial [Thermoguttaceae bacterium]
ALRWPQDDSCPTRTRPTKSIRGPWRCEAHQRRHGLPTAGRCDIAPADMAALEDVLPNRWIAAHPEHHLEQREEESREARARRRKRAARRLAATQ